MYEISSIGTAYLRAKFWRAPVRKDCVKKNPEIQNTFGLPLSIQDCRKERRSTRSVTHDPSGFTDGYATAFHMSGTLPCTMEFPSASRSALMTVRPRIARPISFSVRFTVATRPLNRRHSCVSTVFRDSSNATG